MSVGSIVRMAAGPFERKFCALYRSFFVNVSRCTEQIAGAIPGSAKVIDVGSGDGELVNVLLGLRPDIRISMLDLRQQIGMFLEPEHRARISLHPATSLAAYRDAFRDRADAILVSDVIHHVPVESRPDFLQDCVSLLKPGGVLIIKEVAPGGLVSFLSVVADRYITGDRHVSLLSPLQLIDLVQREGLRKSRDLLGPAEHPNYAISFAMNTEPVPG